MFGGLSRPHQIRRVTPFSPPPSLFLFLFPGCPMGRFVGLSSRVWRAAFPPSSCAVGCLPPIGGKIVGPLSSPFRGDGLGESPSLSPPPPRRLGVTVRFGYPVPPIPRSHPFISLRNGGRSKPSSFRTIYSSPTRSLFVTITMGALAWSQHIVHI